MKYEDIITFIEKKKCFINNEDSETLFLILKKMNIKEKKELNSIKEKADLEFRKGNYQKAVEIYSSYLDLNTENYIIYSNRSASYHKLNLKEKAIEDCKEGMKLCPTFYKFYLRLGFLYLEDDLDKSIYYFEKGLEIDPTNEVLQEQLELVKEKIETLNKNSKDDNVSNQLPKESSTV